MLEGWMESVMPEVAFQLEKGDNIRICIDTIQKDVMMEYSNEELGRCLRFQVRHNSTVQLFSSFSSFFFFLNQDELHNTYPW